MHQNCFKFPLECAFKQRRSPKGFHPWIGTADLIPAIGRRGIFFRHPIATASLSLQLTNAMLMPTFTKNILFFVYSALHMPYKKKGQCRVPLA